MINMIAFRDIHDSNNGHLMYRSRQWIMDLNNGGWKGCGEELIHSNSTQDIKLERKTNAKDCIKWKDYVENSYFPADGIFLYGPRSLARTSIRAVSPEPPLLAHTSSESRGTFRQKARSLAPLNGWACAVKICNDGMLEDTNSLGGAQLFNDDLRAFIIWCVYIPYLSPVKRFCVFEHSVITNCNCACPAIQRGQGSGFLSEGSSWLTACMSEQRRF